MTEKEIAEIRRRISADKSGISNIRGCYVNEQHQIVSDFDQFLGTVEKNEAEELLKIIKKTLSGQIGKNLVGIEFSNQQVVDSDEHRMLMAIRDSDMKDDESISELYRRIIDGTDIEGRFIILLALDKYDVPAYSKDDVKLEDSETVFTYILCSICPVKLTKPALGYKPVDKQFCNIKTDWAISSPQLGFMFPAFDDRQANIYEALIYTKDPSARLDDFAGEVFNTDITMPASEQKDNFSGLIEQTISEDCDLDVVQNIYGQLTQIVEDYKGRKDEPPVTISKKTITDVFEHCAVPTEKVEDFGSEYDRVFGENAKLSPKNVVDIKRFEVKTNGITVKADPEYAGHITTKIINGMKYIMIRAEGDVEVNGVNININE